MARQQAAGVTPPPTLQKAVEDLNTVAKTDEQASVRAQQEFDAASAHLAVSRTKAIDALVAMAPTTDTSTVNLSDKKQPLVVYLDSPKTSTSATGSPTAAASSSRVAMPHTAGELCTEVAGLQQALQRLTQAQATQTADREQWLALMDDATRDAGKQAADYASEGSTTLLTHYFDQRMRDIVVQRAADGIDAGKRKQLDDQFKALRDAKQNVEKWGSQRKQVSPPDPFDVQKWKSLKAKDLEDWLDDIKDAIDSTLAKPEVQRALTLSEDGTKVISLSESIIDSGYSIAREVVSIKQIGMLNENAERYLKAVKALRDKMQDTVNNLPNGVICSGGDLNSRRAP
jgi:truncated hemoglobin YjbI